MAEMQRAVLSPSLERGDEQVQALRGEQKSRSEAARKEGRMTPLIDRRRHVPFREFLDSPSYLKDEQPMPTPAAWRPQQRIRLSRIGVYLTALAFTLSFLYGFCLYVIGPVVHQFLARIF